MKLSLYLLITIIAGQSCNHLQKHVEYYDKEEKMVMFEGYKNSNNQLEGAFSTYKENGQIYEKGTYKKGLLDGEYYIYYKQDSTLKCHLEFKNNKLWNVLEYYSETSKPLYYGNFKDGNGDIIVYFPDSRIYQKGNYKNGLKEGKWDYFAWGDGRLMKSKNYINGKENGSEDPTPNPFGN
jgi:uncharacterized protein